MRVPKLTPPIQCDLCRHGVVPDASGHWGYPCPACEGLAGYSVQGLAKKIGERPELLTRILRGEARTFGGKWPPMRPRVAARVLDKVLAFISTNGNDKAPAFAKGRQGSLFA